MSCQILTSERPVVSFNLDIGGFSHVVCSRYSIHIQNTQNNKKNIKIVKITACNVKSEQEEKQEEKAVRKIIHYISMCFGVFSKTFTNPILLSSITISGRQERDCWINKMTPTHQRANSVVLSRDLISRDRLNSRHVGVADEHRIVPRQTQRHLDTRQDTLTLGKKQRQ